MLRFTEYKSGFAPVKLAICPNFLASTKIVLTIGTSTGCPSIDASSKALRCAVYGQIPGQIPGHPQFWQEPTSLVRVFPQTQVVSLVMLFT